ncbi:MAG: MFS transporter, partial [Anaerolineae bacterium]|nr:MFS transporter [Anaerolineae bacterium]
MLRQKYTLVIICGALVVTISMGVRQAFGIFLQPISDDLGTGREVYSLAIALQNIILGLPLMAIIADRFGSRWIVLAGGVLYAVSLLLVPVIEGAAGLYLSLGLMTGLALSSTT